MVPRHYGVRGERYKLMHFYQFDEWEFYDLANDPDELVNQYENPAYAKQVAEAKVELISDCGSNMKTIVMFRSSQRNGRTD